MVAAPALPATSVGFRDPLFERVGFEKWGTKAESKIRWAVEIPPPELSTHQRLMIRVVTKIDGRELEKRRGEGAFFAMLQITDPAGAVWQNHTPIDLAALHSSVQNQEFFITHYAFVLPGDYALTIAVCDSKTLEHSVLIRKVHVDPVKDDPLPHAFDGLPAVEYVPPTEGAPEVWYLPLIEGKLKLQLATRHRVDVQVLVNTTPAERSLGSAAALRRNMSLVIPAMKVISGVEIANGTLSVALLDLEKRAVPFEQSLVEQSLVEQSLVEQSLEAPLDWYRMGRVFASTVPGIVDAKTLANEWKIRGYFMEELERRLRAPLADDTVRVVIVLSGPAFFEDPNRMVYQIPAHDPARQLYYVRLRTLPVRYPPRNRPGMRPVPQRPTVVNVPMGNDDLEKIALVLNGKVFDATSTEQFRRILATIIEQVSRF